MASALARRTPHRFLSPRLSFSPSSSSFHLPSRSPIPSFHRPFRKELKLLSSIFPIHSAIASARLVSKLHSESNACVQGRFANYVSPI